MNSIEAVAFYMKAFKMELGYNVKNDDGSYLHAELLKNGHEIFSVSEYTDNVIVNAMLSAIRPTMSYGINFETDAELENAYSMLSENGRILRPLGSLPWTPSSADVVDQYGVCWYIYVTQHRPD